MHTTVHIQNVTFQAGADCSMISTELQKNGLLERRRSKPLFQTLDPASRPQRLRLAFRLKQSVCWIVKQHLLFPALTSFPTFMTSIIHQLLPVIGRVCRGFNSSLKHIFFFSLFCNHVCNTVNAFVENPVSLYYSAIWKTSFAFELVCRKTLSTNQFKQGFKRHF